MTLSSDTIQEVNNFTMFLFCAEFKNIPRTINLVAKRLLSVDDHQSSELQGYNINHM
jgi:hypothetical protein